MDFLLDDPAIEAVFQELLAKIRIRQNGVTYASMKKKGANYKVSWGASIISLKELSKRYEKNHLLALKLWNKQWRETMIMATLLDVAEDVMEEQMDYWTKSFETEEMAEQAVANLFVSTKFAYVKALEYCRGKKHLVRYTGLLLIGRLAMTDKKAIDEMFEPFFTVLIPLIKDVELGEVFYRTIILLARRGEYMQQQCRKFLQQALGMQEEHPRKIANLLLEEIAEM